MVEIEDDDNAGIWAWVFVIAVMATAFIMAWAACVLGFGVTCVGGL